MTLSRKVDECELLALGSERRTPRTSSAPPATRRRWDTKRHILAWMAVVAAVVV
jgi:hypothetical protein